MTAFTLLTAGQEHVVDIDAAGRSLATADFEDATGWRVEERGLCCGDVCIPARVNELCADGRIDLAAAATAMRRPWVSDVRAGVGVLGDPAATLADELNSLQAPDFVLPDLDGRVHRLSDFRGRKVLLAAYASW